MSDGFDRQWITQNALEEIQSYEKGVLTLRGLHYRLVARGMTNTLRHYKRVVSAMIKARWESEVSFDTFSDHDRAMIGKTQSEEITLDQEISAGKSAIKSWMNHYSLNRWQNQLNHVEVLIEKKALQGVFQSVCDDNRVALGACKGYPSLTFLYDISERFIKAINRGQTPIILYFGDYDPSGEDIPRSIEENLKDMGVHLFEVRRILLMKDQVLEMNLPPAPAKVGDSRSAKWDGLGQVELDAVEPTVIQQYCQKAIDDVFSKAQYEKLIFQADEEREEYRAALKEFVKSL